MQTPQGTWPRDAFESDVAAGKYKKDEWEKWKTKRLCAEIETRDWGWLWKGEDCKLIEDPEWNENEKETAALLRNQGFNIEYIQRSLEYHQRRADFNLNGVKWEMKNPIGNGYLVVRNQFKKAVLGNANVVNPQSERLVISNVGNNLS